MNALIIRIPKAELAFEDNESYHEAAVRMTEGQAIVLGETSRSVYLKINDSWGRFQEFAQRFHATSPPVEFQQRAQEIKFAGEDG